jgi:Tfp pilus assembly protein PilF
MRIFKVKQIIASTAAVAALLAAAGPAMAEDPAFVLTTTERAMYGTRQVDEGRYEAGAERLEQMLTLAGSSLTKRQPALNDLCVSYTMLGDLDAAEKRCDESVTNGRDAGVALNNRGVMHIAAGNYEAAARDFAAALEAGGVRQAASANLILAQQRVAEIRAEEKRSERTAGSQTDESIEFDGDERAAVFSETLERFADVIEFDTLRLAMNVSRDSADNTQLL